MKVVTNLSERTKHTGDDVGGSPDTLIDDDSTHTHDLTQQHFLARPSMMCYIWFLESTTPGWQFEELPLVARNYFGIMSLWFRKR